MTEGEKKALDQLAHAAEEGTKDPRVLAFLQRLQQKHKGDDKKIASEIFAVVASIPAYMAPFDTEVFCSPGQIIERMGSPGSCVDGDERAALLAALLRAQGYKARLVARSYRPNQQFTHVFVQFQDEDGNWRPALPQEAPPPTAEATVNVQK